MNYNIQAYLIFLTLMVIIIVLVGKYFYINGRVFIVSMLNGNELLADKINKILLVAYYLFNIGYSFVKLNQWESLRNTESLIASLSVNMGTLVLIVAVTHYCNMLVIYYLAKSKILYHINYINHE